jgi:hypothetical protein
MGDNPLDGMSRYAVEGYDSGSRGIVRRKNSNFELKIDK